MKPRLPQKARPILPGLAAFASTSETIEPDRVGSTKPSRSRAGEFLTESRPSMSPPIAPQVDGKFMTPLVGRRIQQRNVKFARPTHIANRCASPRVLRGGPEDYGPPDRPAYSHVGSPNGSSCYRTVTNPRARMRIIGGAGLALSDVYACCAADANAKLQGKTGCGCSYAAGGSCIFRCRIHPIVVAMMLGCAAWHLLPPSSVCPSILAAVLPDLAILKWHLRLRTAASRPVCGFRLRRYADRSGALARSGCT